MNILKLIGQIFKPAVELVDNVHTSDEERLALKAQTLDTYVKAIELGLKYESDQLAQRAKIIEAEAKSEHWITAAWRPITMLSFVGVVLNNYVLAPWLAAFGFDVPVVPIGEDMWGLLQIGIGGYIASRGAEKVVPSIVDALKSKENV